MKDVRCLEIRFSSYGCSCFDSVLELNKICWCAYGDGVGAALVCGSRCLMGCCAC